MLSAFLILSLASCSSAASQCKQFADVTLQYRTLRDSFETNIKSAQVQASGAQDIEDVQTAATAYTQTVEAATSSLDAMLKDLSNLSIADPQLDEYRESYIINLTGYRTALEAAGSAMQLCRPCLQREAIRLLGWRVCRPLR